VELRPEPEEEVDYLAGKMALVNEMVDALGLQRYKEVEVLVRLRGEVNTCPRIELRPKR